MQICLITPTKANSASGNRTTAIRWRNILHSLGHTVHVSNNYTSQPADLMIALHAWRSAQSIQRFADIHPTKPLIVAITGTDAYRFIHSHPKETLHSLTLATKLVGLHALIHRALPIEHKHKVEVIYQSTEITAKRPIIKKGFQVCVAGHLRDEKDSLRPAYAARSLPMTSKINIAHFGAAHSKEWSKKARQETVRNSRYYWHGEVTPFQLSKQFRVSRLLVLPSVMEGGANIISEAIMSDLPVIASNIDGSVGLLGDKYNGYYQVKNTSDLRDILLRCEKDPKFYRALAYQCKQKKKLFTPNQELHSWRKLLSSL